MSQGIYKIFESQSMKYVPIYIVLIFLTLLNFICSYEFIYMPKHDSKDKAFAFTAYAAIKRNIETNRIDEYDSEYDDYEEGDSIKQGTNSTYKPKKIMSHTKDVMNPLMGAIKLGEFRVFNNNTFETTFLNDTKKIFEFVGHKALNSAVKDVANNIFKNIPMSDQLVELSNQYNTRNRDSTEDKSHEKLIEEEKNLKENLDDLSGDGKEDLSMKNTTKSIN